jgi:hypothetical protein
MRHKRKRHRHSTGHRKMSHAPPAHPAKPESVRPPADDPYAITGVDIRDDFVDEAPPDPTAATAKSVAEWSPDPLALR